MKLKKEKPVDPDELQHMDELDVEWVKAWKKRVGKPRKIV
jgi:hypothetical protein